MRRATWQIWATVTVLVIGSYVLVPPGLLNGWPQTIYKVAIGVAAAAALFAGVHRRRPPATWA
jgi:drug/metabolite transporter (DMT)-like permease